MEFSVTNVVAKKTNFVQHSANSMKPKMPWWIVSAWNPTCPDICVWRWWKRVMIHFMVNCTSRSLFHCQCFAILAKGFKTVIRSCASRSTLGVAQGCRYFVDEVGLEVAVCVSHSRTKRSISDCSLCFSIAKIAMVVMVALLIFILYCFSSWLYFPHSSNIIANECQMLSDSNWFFSTVHTYFVLFYITLSYVYLSNSVFASL